ncbi:MAG: hypothetical protein J6J23_05070 [Clostridia bacterium]|nr:hypothetical protein [Clostridia bacterium]
MTDYQMELMVLATAIGFRSELKDGKVYLTTIYKDQVKLFPIDVNSEDAFLGRDKEILAIIDERLGVHSYTKDLKRRYDVYYEALADEDHRFWKTAKSKF